ncbi:hamartin-like isoform X2 [Hippocampus comes]|uniref:hamartin-like isoform X2 n=1 Tax=Hippocampus comes TaxID=109280 RepID=UPI00094E2BBD|nr:PREDICTED: hamartin-like isoform X2 [Hippocampus comes]
MSKEQVSIGELLLSLDSSDLQEAKQGRAAISQQLSSDRGGAVLCSLVDFYLNSSCALALTLLSSIREPLHKALLDKLNEAVSRPANRLAAVTLLGHMISRQPPWIHHVSRSPLLTSLLRCLKSDGDVMVLVPGVLVLVTLLPMIPQAAKQHIYDFFDVFGRLASWSLKNPGHAPASHVVHLHAGVYALFHRLYGMFPCNFLSYLRLHYSMKENLDIFHHVVKPMLDQVRVHPELVSGTQDSEVDPSRWRRLEVHDIIMECSRVSLDPLEYSCDDHKLVPPPLTHLDQTCLPGACSSRDSTWTHNSCLSGSMLNIDHLDLQLDVKWSPSSQCGLSTPPPEMAAVSPAHSLSRNNSLSGVKSIPPALAPPIGDSPDGVRRTAGSQVRLQPIRKEVMEPARDDVEDKACPPQPCSSSCSSPLPSLLLTSTPARHQIPPMSDTAPPPPCSGSPRNATGPAPSYDFLFELALPHAAMLFVKSKTQEAQRKMEAQHPTATLEKRDNDEDVDEEKEMIAASPLQLLDRLIAHGHDTHASVSLSRRSSAPAKSLDRNPSGGKQQSMRSKGSVQVEEAEALRRGLQLTQAQLQYERFKRQQHAIRNRRLLRRVVSAAALEEQSVAMRTQLAVQDEETRALTSNLEAERQRSAQLQRDAHLHAQQLQAHVQQLLQQQQEHNAQHLALQSKLQECQSRMKNLEVELQKSNHKASNAERQLSQLSLKLSSSDKLRQQIFLLNQHLIVLTETNKALTHQLDTQPPRSSTEASMLGGVARREFQRAKEAEQEHRQKLDAANHRAAELDKQLAQKEALIEQHKQLLDDQRRRSRGELSACEAQCTALRKTVQTLQSEMLQLFSALDALSRPAVDEPDQQPSASSGVAVVNCDGVSRLSTSPFLFPTSASSSSPLPLSPIESPLAIGSFLEQRAWELFRPPNHSPEEAEQLENEDDTCGDDDDDDEEEELKEDEQIQIGSPGEDATLRAGSPQMGGCLSPPPLGDALDISLAVHQRRRELSIMDYDNVAPQM